MSIFPKVLHPGLPTGPGFYWCKLPEEGISIAEVVLVGDVLEAKMGAMDYTEELDSLMWQGSKWIGPLQVPPDEAFN